MTLHNTYVWTIFAFMGLGTFLLRLSFIQLFERMTLSPAVLRVLRFIPPAVLSAIIVPDLFAPVGPSGLPDPARLAAAAVAALVAVQTRGMLSTIIAGMAALWIFQTFLPL